MESPRIKSLGKVKPDDCEIFLVDGEKVRDEWSVEFALGGHFFVGPGYDQIPKNEIWVEDTGDPQDMFSNVTHEIVERLLMKFADYDYEAAHEVASSVEEVLRQKETNDEAGMLEELSSIRKSLGGVLCRK